MIQYLQALETIKAAPLDSKTYKFLSQQKYSLPLTTELLMWRPESEKIRVMTASTAFTSFPTENQV